MESSFLGWANLIVLTITAGVITWYTAETWKLRKESQLQTELQVRPFLSLVCHNVGVGDPAVLIVNLGKGLARNVRILPVVLDWTQEVRSDLIPHIAAGAEEIVPWKVWVRLTPADPIGEVPSDQHQMMAGLALTSNDVTVVMRYVSIVGQRYETAVRIREGVAEIIDDWRLPESEQDMTIGDTSWRPARSFLRCYVNSGPSARFKGHEGCYVLLRLGGFLFLSWLTAYFSPSQIATIVAVAAPILALDILIFNTAVVFETGGFGDLLRSLVLTMIGYLTLAIAFVPTWIVLCLDGKDVWPRISAGIYQSVRTLTTAGPDHPSAPLSTSMQLVASAETLLGVYFIGIIVALYTSRKGNANGPTR